MNGDRYANLDEYGLRQMAGHLYRLGLDFYPKLFKLATAHEWHDAQRRFDPSRQSYAESLDWALRAAETDQAHLPVLLVASLLRATVSSFAANVPPTALQVLSLLGQFQRAQAVTVLQADAILQCESLCGLATTTWEKGDTLAAQKSLEQAEAAGQGIADHRPRAHALGLVASTARQLGLNVLADQTFQPIKAILAEKNWSIAAAAREYRLLDQPEYVLALVEWDRIGRSRLSSLREKENIFPVIARIACKRGERQLLDTILAEAQSRSYAYSLSAELLLEALTGTGCTEAAFQLLEGWSAETNGEETASHREAIARAAGSRGDLATIERAASFIPSKEREPGKRFDTASDWDERIEDWKDRLAQSFGRSLKRVGGRLLGTDWEALTVLLSGLDGLAVDHPEQAGVLWARIKKQGNWLTRRWLQEVGGVIPIVSGETSTKVLPRFLDLASRLTALTPDPKERAETLTMLAEAKASMGELAQALEHIDKIEDPEERDTTLAGMVGIALNNQQIDQALELAARVSQAERRKNTLDDIAQFLLSLPPEQVDVPLRRIFALADRLPSQETLASKTTPSALFGSLAEAHSAKAAYALATELTSKPDIGTLTVLCRLACTQDDLNTVREIMVEVEKRLPEIPLQAPGAQSLWRFPSLDTNPFIRQSAQLADISVQCAQAADRAHDSSQVEAWRALSGQAFRLARDHVEELSRLEQPWGWPYLARAARYRKDGDMLQKMLKQVSRVKNNGLIPAMTLDRALVHIAVGLTLTGDYLEPGKGQYPPAVEAIHWHHFKAQALAVMSEAVRTAPPKKGLIGFGRDQQSLEIRANALLNQSKNLLGLQLANLNALLGSRPFTSTPGISALNPQSKLPPKSGIIIQVPTREPLSAIIVIYARCGLYQEVAQIPQQIASDVDRPAVLGTAVKALAEAGRVDRARKLVDGAQTQSEKALGAFELARVLASREASQARQLLEQAFSTVWDTPDQGTALLAYANALLELTERDRLALSQRLLRAARARGRADFLDALTSHVKVFASLAGTDHWPATVKQILETETWWSLSDQ